MIMYSLASEKGQKFEMHAVEEGVEMRNNKCHQGKQGSRQQCQQCTIKAMGHTATMSTHVKMIIRPDSQHNR